MEGNLIKLGDLHSISQDEFAVADRICKTIREIVESRASYVEQHNIDPKIAFGDANWGKDAPNALWDLYKLVVASKYEVIDKLRLYTQPFTGYQLTHFAFGSGKTPIPYPLPSDFDQKLEEIAREPDQWVYGYRALRHCVPADIAVNPPKILGEIGWNIDGCLINHDTFYHQECLNQLYEAGIIDMLRERIQMGTKVAILEIGAGYGGIAYHLKHIIPGAKYFICDIPESLLFSSLYLAMTSPDHPCNIYDGSNVHIILNHEPGFVFIPNFMFDDLVAANIKFDLAINITSFSEMTGKQVRYYAENLKILLDDKGVLFEQNNDNRKWGYIDSKEYLPEFITFKTTLNPKCTVSSSSKITDIWANRRISDILHPPMVKGITIKEVRFFGLVWYLANKIRNIIGVKPFSGLRRFIIPIMELELRLYRLLKIKIFSI